MKRKVIKQGNGTLTITLPKGWTEKIGLKGGDEIDVIANENGLQVRSSSSRKKNEFRISLSKEELSDPRYLEAHLNSLYIVGYDKIIIELPSKDGITKIQSIVKNNFLGYEISSFENGKCIIDNVANPTNEKFDSIFRRLFIMTKSMLNDFYDDVANNDFKNLEFYKEQSKTITHYSNYCLRMISNNQDSKHSYYALWSIVLRVLQVHNIMMYCYEKLPAYKSKISKDALEFFKETNELFDMCYELFYSYDVKKSKAIHNKYYNAVYPNLYGKFMQRKDGEAFLIYHIGKAIRQTLYITQFIIMYNTSKSAELS